MPQLDLFADDPPPRAPQAARLAGPLARLAEQGIHFGTSSWKYEGWLGTIYRPERYQVRGKFSQRQFEATCLQEYAATFPVVGGDFSFYQFPSRPYWEKLFDATPETLRFGLKVPEDLTVARWPGHARYGTRAGTANAGFLDPELLRRGFVEPLSPYADRVAVLMFEFGTQPRSLFPTPEAFRLRLDSFLAALPRGPRYAVEIRNAEYLTPAYCETLAQRGVAHVFNAWTRMPELLDQAAVPGALDAADFLVARALLRHGQAYEQAVDTFAPYRDVRSPVPSARAGLVTLAQHARTHRKPAFLFVNNRLEGNSPGTIEAVAAELEATGA